MSDSPAKTIALAPPSIDEADVAAVSEVLRSRWLVNGPRVADFERVLAERCGVPHAVAVSSGTTALILALRAANVGLGDKVIVPAFTYPATAHAVALVGGEPLLVDVEPTTWNIDCDAVARALARHAGGPRIGALLPVDQFGLPADLPALSTLIAAQPEEARPSLVDDAACALGATRGGRPCLADAPLSCLSFHPRKVITTGEGGAVLVDDDELAAQLRRLRNHGRDASGEFAEVGGNHRMSELAAALGCSQLARLDELLASRRRLAGRYRARLGDNPAFSLQRPPVGVGHTYQTFAVCLRRSYPRQGVLDELQRQGVEATIGTFGLHLVRPYAAAVEPGQFPVADRLARQAIALPLHPEMSEAEVDRVCDALERALAAARR